MKAEEINEAISHYRWLAGIIIKYEGQLHRFETSKRYLKVEKIIFTDCGDPETFEFNTHRTISPEPFIDAVRQCIEDLKNEMEQIREKYDTIDFSDLKPYNM